MSQFAPTNKVFAFLYFNGCLSCFPCSLSDQELFPGQLGGLDSGFNSVDSGSKRWSGNEVTLQDTHTVTCVLTALYVLLLIPMIVDIEMLCVILDEQISVSLTCAVYSVC